MLDRRKFLLGSLGAGIAAIGGTYLAASATDAVRDLLKKAVGQRETVTGMIAVVCSMWTSLSPSVAHGDAFAIAWEESR